jgi:hypothetical protein
MKAVGWRNWGPLSGLGFVALVVAYVVVTPSAPHFDASTPRIVAYYVQHRGALMGSGVVTLFAAALLFLAFVGYLSYAFRYADGRGDGVLSPLVLGSGVVLSAVTVVSVMPNEVLAFGGARTGDAGVVRVLYDMNHLFGGFRDLTLGLFVIAAACGLLQGRFGARWLGWAGLVVVAVNWISGVQRLYQTTYSSGSASLSLVALLGFTAWILALSIVLLRGDVATAGPAGISGGQ